MTHTFTISNETYRTDAETIALIRQYAPAAERGDKGATECLAAIMHLGLRIGRVVKA